MEIRDVKEYSRKERSGYERLQCTSETFFEEKLLQTDERSPEAGKTCKKHSQDLEDGFPAKLRDSLIHSMRFHPPCWDIRKCILEPRQMQVEFGK